ncbi:MAG: hypothetical protein QM610_05425, partial [Chitinophagaceae bacterium]
VRKQRKGALAREVFPARLENSYKAATAAGNVPKRQHDWRAAFAFCGLDFFATFFVKKKSGTDY